MSRRHRACPAAAPPRPILPPARRGGRRIGLLGGSFNPAHEGHRHISLQALKRLRLDELWWMVSPQNPLKSTSDMAPLERRLQRAKDVARHPRIKVTAIERQLRTQFTADTLEALRRRFPQHRFVWIIGADNLIQISRWERWTRIFAAVPVAVFDRPTYSYRALASLAAHRFGRWRQRFGQAGELAGMRPPAWAFIPAARHPASATELRSKLARLMRAGPARQRSTKP